MCECRDIKHFESSADQVTAGFGRRRTGKATASAGAQKPSSRPSREQSYNCASTLPIYLRFLRRIQLTISNTFFKLWVQAKQLQLVDELGEQVTRQRKQIEKLKNELEDEASQNHKDLKQMLEVRRM